MAYSSKVEQQKYDVAADTACQCLIEESYYFYRDVSNGYY